MTGEDGQALLSPSHRLLCLVATTLLSRDRLTSASSSDRDFFQQILIVILESPHDRFKNEKPQPKIIIIREPEGGRETLH